MPRKPPIKLEMQVREDASTRFSLAIYQDSEEDKIRYLRAAFSMVCEMAEMFNLKPFDLLNEEELNSWHKELAAICGSGTGGPRQ